jgi:hypothetical protein
METFASPFYPVQRNADGVFNTASSKLIMIDNPALEALDIWDIANSLSHICRFAGHTRHFYSVAQHSLLVAALAPDELKKEALMHDAAEAYTGDVIKPLKNKLGEKFATIETIFTAAIIQKFGLEPRKLAEVKAYDVRALVLEHKALQLGDARELKEVAKNSGLARLSPCTFCSPGLSQHHFLKTFSLLFPNHPIVIPTWPAA